MGPDLCWKKGAEVKVAHKKIKEKGAEVNVADKKIKEKGVFRKPSGRSNKTWQQETATGEGAPTKANEKPPDEEKEDGDNEEEEEGNVFFIRIHNPRKKSTFEILWRRMPGKLQTSWPMR